MARIKMALRHTGVRIRSRWEKGAGFESSFFAEFRWPQPAIDVIATAMITSLDIR
jgi:hypothetical protein